MECGSCSRRAAFSDPAYCREHFLAYVEEKIRDTIKSHTLLDKKDKVAVAVSGGKDSLTLLYLLKKFGYAVEAFLIDEGITPYRDQTIRDARTFCVQHDIPLHIHTFKEAGAKRVDEATIEGSRCTYCGTLRRNLLNKAAKGFDKLATGHNADDEAQAVVMNLAKAQTALLHKTGPLMAKQEGFVQKIKPLFFCTEKEITAYAFLRGFKQAFIECPFAPLSYRAAIRDILNDQPGAREAKLRLLEQATDLARSLAVPKVSAGACPRCGSPTQSSGVCKACDLAEVTI